MTNPLLVDLSSWNSFDAQTYAPWARQGDGIARILMRSSQGTIRDAKFEQFWSDAVANGIDSIGCYHFAYPNLHPGAAGAVTEANYFASVVGSRLRAGDFLMLDLEQFESAAWAHAFHDALPAALLKNKPVLYDSVSHFQQFFADDLALAAKFDCALAAWPPQMQAPPAAPAGWTIRWWQFTDNDTSKPHIIMQVPGCSFPVDVNMWLGGPNVFIPEGWQYDSASGTLTARNGVTVTGQMAAFILAQPFWRSDNAPLAAAYTTSQVSIVDPAGESGTRQDFEYCSLGQTDHVWFVEVGKELALLKQQQQQADPLAAAAKAALKAWLAS